MFHPYLEFSSFIEGICEIGLVKVIMKMIKAFIGDAEFCESGCNALWKMVEGNCKTND